MKRLFTILLCLCLLLGSVTAFAATGTASAPRANVTDTDPPEIVSITLKENKKTLKPGDVLHLQIKLDDRSVINNVYVQFYNKSKDNYFNFYLNYDAKKDAFAGEQVLQGDIEEGSYVLNYFRAEDKYGNSMFSWSDKGLCSFKLSGTSTAITGTVKLKENGKTIKAEEDSLHVEVVLDQAISDADFALAWFAYGDEGYRERGYSLEKKSDKVFEGEGNWWFDSSDRNGKWVLKEVEICKNEGDNYKALGTIKVSNQFFNLAGGIEVNTDDNKPPEIGSVIVTEKGKTLTAGDMVHVSAEITDESDIGYISAGIDSESVWYTDESINGNKGKYKKSRYIDLQYNASTKKYEGSLQLPQDMPDGKYYLFISVEDSLGNYANEVFDKLYINYKSPDYVDDGMKAFITACWNAIWGKNPTNAQIKKFGKPLATGKQKAVDVILALMNKAKLSDKAAAKALCEIMLGEKATSKNVSAAKKALKTSLEYAIDSLNNAEFRQRCRDWGIVAGNLGTKAAKIKAVSVDVDGGHYVLKGSKATFTGATNKNTKKLVIQDTVKANGKTYKVTSIEGAACKGLAKLTTVTIGKNVTSIGAQAFADCKKLKTITINATKLKTVGENSFSNIKSSAVFKCPKGKATSYEKLIKKTGNPPKKAKFK